MTQKKIFIVSNNVWTIYKFRREVIVELVNRGFHVTFLASFDKQFYVDDLVSLGATYIKIELNRKSKGVVSSFRFFKDLYLLYKNHKPDIVLHYTIKPNIFGGLAAILSRTQYASMITGMGSVFIGGSKLLQFVVLNIYKLSLAKAKVVWVTNKYDQRLFSIERIVANDKVELLYGSGVDTSYFYPESHNHYGDAFVFLLVARIQKAKGVYEYIEAAAILKNRIKGNVIFRLLGAIDDNNVGSIPMKEIVHNVELGVIEYYTETEDVKSYISNANCVVLPSYREGLPTALVEAASMSKPLIATNVPGCADVVIDGYNGFLCNAMDACDLADKMFKMYTLPLDQRIMYGKNARHDALNKFSKDKIVQQKLKRILQFVK